METVVLAAGEGSRMGERTAELPKLFLQVDGKVIYKHQIECLAPYCEQITIVLGHGFDDGTPPESVFDISDISTNTSVQFLTIEKWSITENSYTTLSALEHIPDDEDVLLICGDVIFTHSVIENIIQTYNDDLRADGFSGVGVIEGLQDKMTAVQWDENDIITDYGAIKGHQEVGIFILNAAHRDQAKTILNGEQDNWFPIIFENVPSKPIRVDETERHEINTPTHLYAARKKWAKRETK